MDFIGDLAGVIELITMIFGLVLFPYSQYSYNLEMQRNLFLARTHDNKMFKKDKDQHNCEKVH